MRSTFGSLVKPPCVSEGLSDRRSSTTWSVEASLFVSEELQLRPFEMGADAAFEDDALLRETELDFD